MARPKIKRPVSVAITLSSYDQRWHGYITVGARPNGEPDVRHRSAPACPDCVKTPRPGCACYEKCADKIRKLEDERAAGTTAKAGLSPKLAAYLVDWLAAGGPRKKPWRYGTKRSYKTAVEQYLIPHLGGHRLTELTKKHVETMVDDVTAKVSAQAGAKAHRVLKTALSEAVRQELVHRNAAKMVQLAAADEDEVEPLTVAESQRVIAAADRRPRKARWIIALSLGLRQGEALALAWNRPDRPRLPGDIDLDAGTLTVREKLVRKTWEHGCPDAHACGGAPRPKRPHGHHKLKACNQPCKRHKRACPPPCAKGCRGHASACPNRTGGGLVIEPPKSRSGMRPLQMPVPLVEALRDRKDEQDAERDLAGSEWCDTGLVFTNVWGGPIDPRQDWADWHELLRDAKVPPAKLHDARHTAATFLLVQGVDLRVVMALMGWSQASMAKRYQHVVDALRVEAARRMQDLLWPGHQPAPAPRDPSDSSTDHATSGDAKIIQFRPKAV